MKFVGVTAWLTLSLGFGALLAACHSQQGAPSAPVAPQSGATVVGAAAAPGPIRRVVLVTIDGLKPENYLRPEEHGLSIPTLRWVSQQGAVSDGVRSVFPTLTYPSHTSIATGTNPSRHHIFLNRSFDPLETDLDGWRWYAEDIASPTLWQLAEAHGLPTAIVYWPVTVGAQVHWLVPEFWRASNVQDQKLQRVVSTPGLLDAVAREHPDFWARFVPPAIGDDAITDISIHVLSTGKPRLLMTHLVEVDSAQHRYGVDSPEAHAAIEKDDAQIARLMRAVEALGLKEETAFVIASDHGFRAAPKAIRPCAVLAEAGLLTERAGKLTDWKATVQAHAGAAYVYVADPTDEATQRRVRQLFEAKLAQPGSGISQLYERETLVELGGDPAALFALGASPGYQFAPGCRGAYEVETGYAATHGYDPREPDMSASLLMVGPSLPHGKLVGARLIDLAPTIAGWLGLSMPSAEGVPLTIVPSP